MRKIFVITMSFCGLFGLTYAQTANVQFGVKGGVNLSSIKTPDITSNSKSDFHAGAFTHIHLNKNFAIQPEIIYSRQGGDYNNVKLKTDYVNIPVLGQYMFGNGFRLQTGPQIGFLTNADVEVSGNKQAVREFLNTTEFSWAFGAGFLTKSGLGIDARYNLGISDIAKDAPEIKNRTWQFGLFYQFR